MFFTLLVILIISFIFFCIYRLIIKYSPKLIFNENGAMAKILSKMSFLKKPYKPIPWFFNRHIQTLYGLRLRGRSKYQPKREDVIFKDGGQVTIEYFVDEKLLTEESPIAFLIHIMGGSSRESCTNFMATFLMKKKYRVIICSCRGCNGSKITSKRLYNGYQTDDLKFIIDHINTKYPKAKNKFLIGFSLGSMVACQYAVDFDDLDGVVCISHTIRPYQGTQFLEKGWKRKIYYSVMINHLKHVALKSSFYTEEEKNEIKKTNLFKEFDNIVTAKNMGLNNAFEYYDLLLLEPKIDKIKIPCLFILSEDDPFSKKEWIPVDKIKRSQNVAFVVTKEGGHVGFFQNWNTKVTYSEEVTLNFIETISELKNSINKEKDN